MKRSASIILAVAVLFTALLVTMFFTYAQGGSFWYPWQALRDKNEVLPSSTSSVVVPSPSVVPFVGPTSTPIAGNGYVVGHLDIGPICPVERDPPDPNCQPGPRHYDPYTMVAYDAARKRVIKEAAFDAQGNYRIELSAGTYVIDIAPHLENRIGGPSGVPQSVEVKKGSTVTVNVTIDTGIR